MSFKEWWTSLRAAPSGDRGADLRLASAALLMEIARSDASVEAVEEAAMAEILAERWSLDEADVARLMREAAEAVDRAVSLVDFTRVLVETLSVEERGEVVDLLWRVAWADGQVDKYEDYTVRKLADLLYVSHSRFVQGKLRAAGELD